MRGISPLIASILLIALTMTIAVILANWATGITQQTLATTQRCIGARLEYTTADYPKWNPSDGSIVAVITSYGATMGKFKFEILLTNDTILVFPDKTNLILASGSTGTVMSDPILVSRDNIRMVRITSNCTDVKTTWESLK
ncbi:MAG: hypothetical protein QXF15_03930 [Candidatus Aenigmatarchaeota archaeon]|nr:hypothetical protein [Candidatus Aenigmarchaeota archaeon]